MKSLHISSINHHKTILALRLSSLLILSLFLSVSTVVYGHTIRAHIFIYAGCSEEKYQPNSPFEGSLNSFLSSVVNSSPNALFNSFAIGNGSSSSLQEGSVYGLFQCRGDLKTLECTRCVASAVNQIGLVCPYALGASLQLEGCLLRYEHFDFLGKLDTGLRYKKCSKSLSNDVEFFRRRDDVLADLQGATSFRVSSSGLVEGFAQCVGDLSPSDCSSCLAESVGKLKSLCGSASAADVYLAQCFARYWGSGYYDLSSGTSYSCMINSYI